MKERGIPKSYLSVHRNDVVEYYEYKYDIKDRGNTDNVARFYNWAWDSKCGDAPYSPWTVLLDAKGRRILVAHGTEDGVLLAPIEEAEQADRVICCYSDQVKYQHPDWKIAVCKYDLTVVEVRKEVLYVSSCKQEVG